MPDVFGGTVIDSAHIVLRIRLNLLSVNVGWFSAPKVFSFCDTMSDEAVVRRFYNAVSR